MVRYVVMWSEKYQHSVSTVYVEQGHRFYHDCQSTTFTGLHAANFVPHPLLFHLPTCHDRIFISDFVLLLCGSLAVVFRSQSAREDPGRCDDPIRAIPWTGRIRMAAIGHPPSSEPVASGIPLSSFIVSISMYMFADGQEINVVFRPKSSEVYDDVIFFKVLDGPNAGGFNVPVRALLPTLQVTQWRFCRLLFIRTRKALGLAIVLNSCADLYCEICTTLAEWWICH